METDREYILYISPTHIEKIMKNGGLEHLSAQHTLRSGRKWEASIINREIMVKPVKESA